MSRLVLSPEVVDRLELKAATEAEAKTPPALLPATVGERAVLENVDEFVRLLAAALTSGIDIEKPETVPAAKATRGRRPVAVLTIQERVIYRALVAALETSLTELDRTSEAFESFKAAPMAVPGAHFVVMADIASCYQYIDHQLMREELLALTGEASLVTGLGTLLSSFAGREFGVPQNNYSSDVVANVVVDIIERRMLRSGHHIWRYNDDFRIASASRRQAHLALEELEAECTRLGLTLNDEKTSIKNVDGYTEWADAVNQRRQEIESDVEFDLTVFTGYGEDEPGREDIDAASAVRALQIWKDDLDEQRNQFGPAAVVNRSLAQGALTALSALVDASGLSYCDSLLTGDPSLTPSVARYLNALMPAFEGEVDHFLDSLVESADAYLSDWQALWLAQPLKRSTELTAQQIAWQHNLLGGSTRHVVRAEAGFVLAFHGQVQVGTLSLLFNSCSAGARGRLVAAIAAAARNLNDEGLRAITRDAPLYRWIAEAVIDPHMPDEISIV